MAVNKVVINDAVVLDLTGEVGREAAQLPGQGVENGAFERSEAGGRDQEDSLETGREGGNLAAPTMAGDR